MSDECDCGSCSCTPTPNEQASPVALAAVIRATSPGPWTHFVTRTGAIISENFR